MLAVMPVVATVSISCASIVVSLATQHAQENAAVLGIEEKRFQLSGRLSEWHKDRSESFSVSDGPHKLATQTERVLNGAMHLKAEAEAFKDFADNFDVMLPSSFHKSFKRSAEKTIQVIEEIDLTFLTYFRDFNAQMTKVISKNSPNIEITPTHQALTIESYKLDQLNKLRTVTLDDEHNVLELMIVQFLSHMIRAKHKSQATPAQLTAFKFPAHIAAVDLVDFAAQYLDGYAAKTGADGGK